HLRECQLISRVSAMLVSQFGLRGKRTHGSSRAALLGHRLGTGGLGLGNQALDCHLRVGDSFRCGLLHEGGRRAGTESALLAAGLGKACELAVDLAPMERVCGLRDYFWSELQKRVGNRAVINGHPIHRLPNTLNISFVDCIGADILERLGDVAASTGSACHSVRIELSPGLKAMGVATRFGSRALRFSLGRSTTDD